MHNASISFVINDDQLIPNQMQWQMREHSASAIAVDECEQRSVLGFIIVSVFGFEHIDRRVRFPALANPTRWGEDGIGRDAVRSASHGVNGQSNAPMTQALRIVTPEHPRPFVARLVTQVFATRRAVQFDHTMHPRI